MARIGRESARRQLLRMSDRTLADAGFSRASLESGVGAWPWRHDEDDAAAAVASCAERAGHAFERLAAHELRAGGDAEAGELGNACTDVGHVACEVGAGPTRDGGGERWAA